MKKNKYVVASFYYLLGNIVGQGIVLLSSGIFTRLLSTSDFGYINTYSSYVLILNTFIGLNLFITVRNGYLDFKEDYNKFVSSVLLLSLCGSFSIILILLLIMLIFHIRVNYLVFVLAILQAISTHTINFLIAKWAMENRYLPRMFLMIIPNLLHTILSVLLILLASSDKYLYKILGNSIGMLVVAISIIIYIFKIEIPKINLKYWKYALKISIPSIFNTLSDLILMQSDRIMLTSLVGLKETGVYSLIYNISSIIIALYVAINGAWIPWFYSKISDNEDKNIKETMNLYIIIFCYLTIGILFLTPELLKILGTSAYSNGLTYVWQIVVSSFIIYLYVFFTNYFMYLKRTGLIAINTILAAIINILLNFVLIPKYKGVGAANATLISYSLLFLLYFYQVRKSNRDFYSLKVMLTSILSILIASFIFNFLINYFILRFMILIFLSIILLLILYLYLKSNNKIDEIYKIMRRRRI